MTVQSVTVVGKLNDPLFQKAKKSAEIIMAGDPSFRCTVLSMMPTDYEVWTKEAMRAAGGSGMALMDNKANLVAFEGEPWAPAEFIGAGNAFMKYLRARFDYVDKTNQIMYQRLAKIHLRTALASSGHPHVFMTLYHGEALVGKIVIECFDHICPKTVANFVELVKGKHEAGRYEGTRMNRVVKKGWLQGGNIAPVEEGDVVKSTYGGAFADETFNVKHDKMGIVGMVGSGPHSNGCQFYMTLDALGWLDGKAVAFGYVVDGMRVLRVLEKVPCSDSEAPLTPITIKECGLFTV